MRYLMLVTIMFLSLGCSKTDSKIRKVFSDIADRTVQLNFRLPDGSTPSVTDYSNLDKTVDKINIKSVKSAKQEGGETNHFAKAEIIYKVTDKANTKNNHKVYHYIAIKIHENGFGDMIVDTGYVIKQVILTETFLNEKEFFKPKIDEIMN